jgi:hypothetical protein
MTEHEGSGARDGSDAAPGPAPRAALADELALLAAGVPGVAALYSARPAVAAALGNVVGSVVNVVARDGRSPDRVAGGALVHLRRSDAALAVSVRIGVGELDSAAEVCRRVHDAIADYLDAHHDGAVGDIAVAVARIG